MKILITVMHLILGLLLVFYGLNEMLHLSNLVTLSPDKQYYYGISIVQGFFEASIVVILGLFSIVSVFAFRKDKRWAIITLPLPIGVLFLWVGYILFSSTRADLAWTGGIMTLLSLILLVFLVSEILYLVLRKNVQIY